MFINLSTLYIDSLYRNVFRLEINNTSRIWLYSMFNICNPVLTQADDYIYIKFIDVCKLNFEWSSLNRTIRFDLVSLVDDAADGRREWNFRVTRHCGLSGHWCPVAVN